MTIILNDSYALSFIMLLDRSSTLEAHLNIHGSNQNKITICTNMDQFCRFDVWLATKDNLNLIKLLKIT